MCRLRDYFQICTNPVTSKVSSTHFLRWGSIRWTSTMQDEPQITRRSGRRNLGGSGLQEKKNANGLKTTAMTCCSPETGQLGRPDGYNSYCHHALGWGELGSPAQAEPGVCLWPGRYSWVIQSWKSSHAFFFVAHKVSWSTVGFLCDIIIYCGLQDSVGLEHVLKKK